MGHQALPRAVGDPRGGPFVTGEREKHYPYHEGGEFAGRPLDEEFRQIHGGMQNELPRRYPPGPSAE